MCWRQSPNLPFQACLPFWTGCLQFRIPVYPKECKKAQKAFLTSAAFQLSEARLPLGEGGQGTGGWLPNPPPPTVREGPQRSCRQRTSHQARRQGAKHAPAHPCKMATVGKKICCVLPLTAQQGLGFPWGDLREHPSLPAILLGSASPCSLLLKVVAYHLS